MARRVREAVKHKIEGLVVRARATELYRSLSGGRDVILGYHNVVPDEAPVQGDGPLHLRLGSFREQLDHLLEGYEPVPLRRILEPRPEGTPRPRAAVTFDDAYLGAVRFAVPELVERRIPATIFVSPEFVGGGSFWWDAIGNGCAGHIPEETRRRAVYDLEGDDTLVRRWAAAHGLELRSVPEMARCASEAHLSWADGQPGIALAPHGWSHRNLTRLPLAELEEELAAPLRWLTERFDTVVPWLTYPYGLHDARVERACAAAGYEAALGIGTGTLPREIQNRHALPRISIPAGLSRNGFALRAAGIVRG